MPGSRVVEIDAVRAHVEAQGGLLLPEDGQAIAKSTHDATTILDLYDWANRSMDDEAVLARERNWSHRFKSLLKEGEPLQKRLKLSKAWVAAGRPTGPPARAAPTKGRRFESDQARAAREIDELTAQVLGGNTEKADIIDASWNDGE
jgi:hypothetical protein